MKYTKVVFPFVIFFITFSILAQKTAIYTNSLSEYNHAIELYQNKAFVAAQQKFNEIKFQFDNSSELKANCEYYAANCAIRLEQPNSDDLMQKFVDKYPTSLKRNSAFMDVANYYFKIGKYSYAAKWYSRVNTINLTIRNEEAFNFKYAYSLFANKAYTKAKEYFLLLLDSQEYGAQAKYYYGYIAYKDDDYETADAYLGEVVEDKNFKTDVSYYLADMNFKLGKFEKAIEYGLPLLEKAKRVEHSEISKIVGESYFNLQKYDEAILHLNNYKGKRGKWNNTDYYFLGYAYYQKNDFENAINNFNKIINGNNDVAQNAYYHLAECYLKLEKKNEALNAFKNAAEMKFKPEIQKDAWLNYAKLSYEIGNPYKSVPDVLQEYIELYPNSENKNEINDLIISAYITSKDYEGALDYLKNKKSEKERSLFQKVAFYRGVELFVEGNYESAKENFENSLTIPLDANFVARATFWKGECNYRLNNFSDALTNFKTFISYSEASKTEEFEHINYNIGYAYFKQKDYEKAIEEFKNYINKNTDDAIRRNDSYLRIGDGYFASSNYTNAITYYKRAIEMKGIDADYAQFQIAISYGLINKENDKIATLNSFLNTHLKSTYRDDALFVLGNSYINKNQNELALENFDNLISNYKRSPLVSKALLKKGLIFYNTERNEQALSTYKTIVTRFPNTAEAKQAVKNTRQIYVDLGRVDEYAAWVKNIDFVNVTNAELDNDTYESAEKQYLQNNHTKSIESFTKYLQSFPKGLHILKANFYLAQSLFSENQHSKAIPYYTYVINQERNEFTENALSSLSQVYLENNNWESAIPTLERLEKEADLPQNITFSQSNLMKGYYENKEYSKAVNYAELVLKNAKLENRIKSDAHLIIARSAIKTKNEEKARIAYKEVEKIASGELKAEALYFGAYFENRDGSYRVSNEIVQKIAADYAAYKYWGAKGLILMATNYYELQDAYQATYILESVLKNFAEFDDVVEEATKELNRIKTEQAKTNESVKN
ncbi:tetratricopeptide repeat protein [Lutibacter sp.]|uniref:tetratricopeptide repeat protein n=1 Tax=Lutibacter sp. TaxID=1925666 RepID=UPI0035699270